MVAMQGEDSGIAWETTPSRCSTPWASEGGGLAVDLAPEVAPRAPTPASASAGKIIFVMDEGMMTRRKRSKEIEPKRRLVGQREATGGVSERPELVEVSLPNVKTEDAGEDVADDPPADRLFSLVSEGSEILNIVVPTKLATVDEEESRDMVDNLSYMEESPVPKASEDTEELQQVASTAGPSGEGAGPIRVMDPPGAPVARPPNRRASGVVDYFEAYTLIDGQAPGGPAVVAQEVERSPEVAVETQGSEVPPHESTSGAADMDLNKSDTFSLEEFTSEHLDDVFYGGTDAKPGGGPGGVAERAPSRGPSKPSGSILFGGEEDVLTPIFLPDGPPKIIDPILLEEPKAMAFLYTDLYEEAVGCRTKEEDTVSLGSEKSFHSRHSDREARGYLEKYVLIDETPVVEMEAAKEGKHLEEGPRVLSQDLYDYSNLRTKPDSEIQPELEEEITDFFRSSASSSPCELEPFNRSPRMEEDQPTTETKEKKKRVVTIEAKPDLENTIDQLGISDLECPYEELDWGITDDHLSVLEIKPERPHQQVWRDALVQTPVAPPRKKTSSPKTRLDLCPLTPVEVGGKEDASGKEQRDGEKQIETAPQAKSADKGETQQTCSATPSEGVVASAEEPQREGDRDNNGPPPGSTTTLATEEEGAEQEACGAEAAREHTEPKDVGSSGSKKTTGGQKEDKVSQMSTEPAKEKGRCMIM